MYFRPFLNILEDINDVEPSIQDMVMRCVSQLIQSQWTNIRSGWTNIFLVLYIAAASTEEGVIELAFGSCSFVINTVFPNNFYLLIDSFPVSPLAHSSTIITSPQFCATILIATALYALDIVLSYLTAINALLYPQRLIS